MDLPSTPLTVGAVSQRDRFVANATRSELLTFERLMRLLVSAVDEHVRLAHTPLAAGFAPPEWWAWRARRNMALFRDEVSAS